MNQEILFVHDLQESPVTRKNYLEMLGFQVTLVRSVDECLKVLAVRKPALILMDVLLEGQNGFQACRTIRERVNASEVPIVLCSHIYRSRIYRDEANTAGVGDRVLLMETRPLSKSKRWRLVEILDRMADVGLGYLTLGQPLTTLSGGERQRLKLATQMAEKGDVYVLDEPTVGLHLADVEQLLGLLDRLVDSGRSVIVIEHHQAVMAHADWIIDLGPGAGHDGGTVVFEGTPADLVAARSTLTGEHLADYVTG